MGLSYCEGEQSTKINYSVITCLVNNRLHSLSFPLLKYLSQRINPRAIDKFWWLSFLNVLLFWKQLLSKTLPVGSWQLMAYNERAAFHTTAARIPLDLDPWQWSFSLQLYFSSVSASLPQSGELCIPRHQRLPLLAWITALLPSHTLYWHLTWLNTSFLIYLFRCCGKPHTSGNLPGWHSARHWRSTILLSMKDAK